MSLLDEAKALKNESKRQNDAYNKEVIDLALAWARREISNKQFETVLKIKQGNCYSTIARSLREAFTQGILK